MYAICDDVMKFDIFMTGYNDNFNKQGNGDKVPVYDSFIDSVEEEIRKENYQKLWNKYGKLVSAVVALSLLGTMGYSFWKKRDIAEKEAVSEQFTLAQNELNSGKNDSALTHFREMSKNGKKNYATFAKLEYASLLHEKRDKKAIAEYKTICDDNKTPGLYRELAYIYYVNASLDLLDEKSLKTLMPEFIEKLSKKSVDKKWTFLALESLGYCYIKLGKYEDAKSTFAELAKMEKIPDAMLERTRETLQYINQQIDQIKSETVKDNKIKSNKTNSVKTIDIQRGNSSKTK